MVGEARHSIFASLRTRWRELLVGRRMGDSTYGDYKAVNTSLLINLGTEENSLNIVHDMGEIP
jgi:hypothetical protein